MKGNDWQSRRAALQKAIRRITKASDERAEMVAHDLMRRSPVAHPKDVPAKKGLLDVARKATDTVKVLTRLPETALAKLNFSGTALRDLRRSLRVLAVAANQAAQEVGGVGGRPRRARSSAEREIAFRAAAHYCVLTGKQELRASREFIELLRATYEALGIKAGARAQAKALVELGAVRPGKSLNRTPPARAEKPSED